MLGTNRFRLCTGTDGTSTGRSPLGKQDALHHTLNLSSRRLVTRSELVSHREGSPTRLLYPPAAAEVVLRRALLPTQRTKHSSSQNWPLSFPLRTLYRLV